MKYLLKARLITLGVSAVLLSACVAKDVELSEQQRRMQRCDQYVGQQRDECLRGMPVTIDDYKDDYRDYIKSRKREAKADEPTPIILTPTAKEPEIKDGDKPKAG